MHKLNRTDVQSSVQHAQGKPVMDVNDKEYFCKLE